MGDDFTKTKQDLQPPRMSWYEQRRPAVGDDKSTTITLNWSKVGPMIGLVVFIGGLVTTSVNAAVSVAQYKAQIEASERKLEEHQTQITRLQEQVTRLSALQEVTRALQNRMAALEDTPPVEDPEQEVLVRGYRRNPYVRPPHEMAGTAP